MYDPGHPPTWPGQVPSRAWIVSMRVLFGVLSVCSLGFLLWTPLLRLAIVRRRAFDWWLAGAGFVFIFAVVLILGRDGSDEPVGIDNVLIPLMMLLMVAAFAYYLVGDIRHYAPLTRRYLMGGYAPLVPGYAYAPTVPMRAPAPALTDAPTTAPAPAPTTAPAPALTDTPTPAPAPAPTDAPAHAPMDARAPTPAPAFAQWPPDPVQPQPRPQRIDQVRAELDELSDYLRKEEGR